jgi:hypothetical protein
MLKVLDLIPSRERKKKEGREGNERGKEKGRKREGRGGERRGGAFNIGFPHKSKTNYKSLCPRLDQLCSEVNMRNNRIQNNLHFSLTQAPWKNIFLLWLSASAHG